MKIHKIGHCCLVIEHKDTKIMTDPGNFTTGQEEVMGLDVLIITHEHQDHFHIDSVKLVIANNPNVRIITNESIYKLLQIANIQSEIVKEGESVTINDIVFTANGHAHAEIYNEIGLVENTGFQIDDLFYPADSFTKPIETSQKIKFLALQVAGPWMKTKDAIDYALSFGTITAFPVHDGFFLNPGPFHAIPERVFKDTTVTFIPLKAGYDLDTADYGGN